MGFNLPRFYSTNLPAVLVHLRKFAINKAFIAKVFFLEL